MTTESKCPFSGGKQPAPQDGPTNQDWWPNQLSLKPLHQHSPLSDPMDKDFNYADAFNSLDLAAVKQDLHALMTDGPYSTQHRLYPLDTGPGRPEHGLIEL